MLKGRTRSSGCARLRKPCSPSFPLRSFGSECTDTLGVVAHAGGAGVNSRSRVVSECHACLRYDALLVPPSHAKGRSRVSGAYKRVKMDA